jgi:CRP-like cAMP-binding protein
MQDVLAPFRSLPKQQLEKGVLLFREGERSGKLYILVEGSVEVLKEDLRITAIREPGAVFGEMSILLQIPHTATVVVQSPSTFHILESPMPFLHEHPDAMVHVAQILAHRLRSLTQYLLNVKDQFKETEGHLGLVNEVLDTLIHHHPRLSVSAQDLPPPSPED